jgi:hypothetical protein
MFSPRSCPRDELTSGYVSPTQLSCAMSSSFDTPVLAVTRELQSSSATTLAAVARAIVFAPQRSPTWFPKPMISVSQLTSLDSVSQIARSLGELTRILVTQNSSSLRYSFDGWVAPSAERGSQRLRTWLPKCQLVPQRSFRAVSRSKSRLKTLSHRSVARTMSNTSGPTHEPVARSTNLPGSLTFQFPGR